MIWDPKSCFYVWINLVIIGSARRLTPFSHQAIIWTNADLLLYGCSDANFSEILIKI